MKAFFKISCVALGCTALFVGCNDGAISDDNDGIDVTPGGGSNADDGGSGGQGDEGGSGGEGGSGTSDEGGSGGDGGTASEPDGGSPDVPDASTDPGDLMCDLEEADLNDCDLCVRQSCCDEIIACSESDRCSGDPSAGGFATGDFGALQDCIDTRFDEDGFVDTLTVEECSLDVDAGEVALALSDCILAAEPVETDAGAADSCGFSCFGIVE